MKGSVAVNHRQNSKIGSVMIVGGGIAGMQSAYDIAENGYTVKMLTLEPSIGGRMARLDRTFPTNDCAMCLLGPKMTEVVNHPNIELFTAAKLIGLEGNPGNFQGKVELAPRFVDMDECTACGDCEQVCPVPDMFNEEMSVRKAIYKIFPQAVPNKYLIDQENCIKCNVCVKTCKKKAINLEAKPRIIDVNVGAVILAPGFEVYPAQKKAELGYGYYDNVVNSLGFERMLSSTGPTGGHIKRPFDEEKPKRIAFIQCVGSRDYSGDGNEYCSSVCCMHSTKQAIIAKEHDPEIECTVFYIDIRSFGKNFDKYVDYAKEKGVKYIKTLVSSVKEDPVNKNLFIRYHQNEILREEEFGLIVLAVGINPPKDTVELAQITGIELNKYGFALTDNFNPTQSSKEGIFVAGVFQGPMDIPETIMNASAAAAAAGSFLSQARHVLTKTKEYPLEKLVEQEDARVGVIICHCGTNISSVVNIKELAGAVVDLPGVCIVEDTPFACSQNSLKRIKEIVHEYNLNRLVVAACTIRTHQAIFKEMLKEIGLNPYLFEMANIREQCAWVHIGDKEKALEKAVDLLKMAIAKVKTHESLSMSRTDIIPRALIIGAGPAGMQAALSFAEQGYESYLLEKQSELGGFARNLHRTLNGENIKEFLTKMITDVKRNPLINIYTNAVVEQFNGHQGHFDTVISQGEFIKGHLRKTTKLEHGVVVIATGSEAYEPSEYSFGEHKQITTNFILERQLLTETWDIENKKIVMIQCVGSRTEQRNYCSRTCCAHSLKNALIIKEKYPDVQIFVLYQDMRSYGFMEEKYRRARELGVIFIKYDPQNKPQVNFRSGKMEVEVYDSVLEGCVFIEADQLVLANGALGSKDAEKIASIFRVPLNEDGFFMETHAKLGPMDFPSPGIFMCGSCHSPKFLSESIYQAQGATARACAILSKKYFLIGGITAEVDAEKCVSCMTCVRVCPYSVPMMNENFIAEIQAVQCQGCGICAAECPGGAIQLRHYKNKQITAKISALLRERV